MTEPLTVRGYLTGAGDVLLKPRPDLPAWLSDLLREYPAGGEVLITITVESTARPAWLGAAARALEAPRPLVPPRHKRVLHDPAARVLPPPPHPREGQDWYPHDDEADA